MEGTGPALWKGLWPVPERSGGRKHGGGGVDARILPLPAYGLLPLHGLLNNTVEGEKRRITTI